MSEPKMSYRIQYNTKKYFYNKKIEKTANFLKKYIKESLTKKISKNQAISPVSTHILLY